jgi:hypothetical protein
MPRVFNERTTDRVVATADERSSAVIARTALRRVMSESESLYTKPYLAQWVQGKIDIFKENLRAQIEQEKNSTKKAKDTHFPDLYAKMLREELEYIELCIEYNDKVQTTVSEDGFLVEKIVEKFDNNETKKYKSREENLGPSEPTRVVGKIDLSKPDSKPEWK